MDLIHVILFAFGFADGWLDREMLKLSAWWFALLFLSLLAFFLVRWDDCPKGLRCGANVPYACFLEHIVDIKLDYMLCLFLHTESWWSCWWFKCMELKLLCIFLMMKYEAKKNGSKFGWSLWIPQIYAKSFGLSLLISPEWRDIETISEMLIGEREEGESKLCYHKSHE